jgi:hypothetical protein
MAMLEVRNSDNQAEQVKARATFQTTLDEFQFKAPVGSFKIDIIIKQLNAKRGTTVDVVEMRKGLWRAAYLSAMDAHHTKHEHPAWVREATNYIENLRSARAALAAASMADIGHMCRTLRFIPNDPSDLASHLQYQNVKREFEQLNADMQRAHLRLSEYLDRNVLPEYKPPANAADHFMRSFLALAAAAVWAEKFGPLRKRDSVDFVRVIATVLVDFGYALTAEQQKNDDWLRRRVARDLFKK